MDLGRRRLQQVRFGHRPPARRGVWQAVLLLVVVLACNLDADLRGAMGFFAVLTGLLGTVAALAALLDRRARPGNYRQDLLICQICAVIIIGVLLGWIPGMLAV